MPAGTEDYAAEGDLTPVRFASDGGPSEVLWGARLCPARVRLKGIPVLTTDFGFGDEVLIDGVPDGEVPRDGQNVPVFNVLAVLKTAERSTLYLERARMEHGCGRAHHALDQEDIPWADWRPMSHLTPYPIAISLPRDALDEDTAWGTLSQSEAPIGRWVLADPFQTESTTS